MKATYSVFKNHFGEYTTCFFVGNNLNTDYRGTCGTGVNNYYTEKKAKAAGRRYLRNMKKLGFEI